MMIGIVISPSMARPVPATSDEEPSSALDPENKSADVTLSEDNFRMTSPNSDRGVKSVVSLSSGKHYFEVDLVVGYQGTPGVANAAASVNTYGGSSADSCVLDLGQGQALTNNSYLGSANFGVALQQGDIVGFAVDLDARKMWFSLNGAFGTGHDPEAPSGGFDILSGELYVMLTVGEPDGSLRLKSGSDQFTHNPPAGFGIWA